MSLRLNKSIGALLLAIWLIFMGLAAFLPVLGALAPVLAVVAIAAGVLIALGH